MRGLAKSKQQHKEAHETRSSVECVLHIFLQTFLTLWNLESFS